MPESPEQFTVRANIRKTGQGQGYEGVLTTLYHPYASTVNHCRTTRLVTDRDDDASIKHEQTTQCINGNYRSKIRLKYYIHTRIAIIYNVRECP